MRRVHAQSLQTMDDLAMLDAMADAMVGDGNDDDPFLDEAEWANQRPTSTNYAPWNLFDPAQYATEYKIKTHHVVRFFLDDCRPQELLDEVPSVDGEERDELARYVWCYTPDEQKGKLPQWRNEP